MKQLQHLRRFVRRNRFLIAIAGAIGVSLVMVAISMTIYMRDGVLLLDLSRPGYAPVREKIQKPDETPVFSADGGLDAGIVQDFYTQLKKKVGEANQLGTFDSAALSDKALQLAP